MQQLQHVMCVCQLEHIHSHRYLSSISAPSHRAAALHVWVPSITCLVLRRCLLLRAAECVTGCCGRVCYWLGFSAVWPTGNAPTVQAQLPLGKLNVIFGQTTAAAKQETSTASFQDLYMHAPNGTYTLRFSTNSDLVCPSSYLCCAMLCSLCCAVPCCAVPCCALPRCAFPCCAPVLCSRAALPCCAVQRCPTLHTSLHDLLCISLKSFFS